MGNQITNLTQAVAAAEIEVSDLRGEESKLHCLISERSNDIRQADEILAGPYRYPSHREAQSARYAALRGRSEASNALISLQVDSNRASIRLVELRRDLARAQYEAVSDADLKRKAFRQSVHLTHSLPTCNAIGLRSPRNAIQP